MNATAPKEEDCEACFGKGTTAVMRSPRPLGQPMDLSPGPTCPDCKGTGKKPKAS